MSRCGTPEKHVPAFIVPGLLLGGVGISTASASRPLGPWTPPTLIPPETGRIASAHPPHPGPPSLQKLAVTAGVLSMSSMLAFAGNAAASTEMAQLAAGDNRLTVILSLFVPVIGWVLFNALRPGLNQLDQMNEVAKNRKGAIVGAAAGLGGLLAAQGADAAEIAEIAAGDNRLTVILSLFVPVIGWVLFNALRPGLNQLDQMNEVAKNRK